MSKIIIYLIIGKRDFNARMAQLAVELFNIYMTQMVRISCLFMALHF